MNVVSKIFFSPQANDSPQPDASDPLGPLPAGWGE